MLQKNGLKLLSDFFFYKSENTIHVKTIYALNNSPSRFIKFCENCSKYVSKLFHIFREWKLIQFKTWSWILVPKRIKKKKRRNNSGNIDDLGENIINEVCWKNISIISCRYQWNAFVVFFFSLSRKFVRTFTHPHNRVSFICVPPHHPPLLYW